MKTLYLAGAVLSGVLAVASAQADQCAKAGNPTGDLQRAAARPSGKCQLQESQLSEVSAGRLGDRSRSSWDINERAKPSGSSIDRAPADEVAQHPEIFGRRLPCGNIACQVPVRMPH